MTAQGDAGDTAPGCNDKRSLLYLYEMSKSEQFHFLNAHHSRVVYYSGVITTLLAAILAGLLKAKEIWHYIALLLGTVLNFIVVVNAFAGTWRPYQRFLEAVTVSIKVEEMLRLAKEPEDLSGRQKWYQMEAILPTRHANSRDDYHSSQEFIKGHKRQGFRRTVIWLLWGFLICDIAMGVIVIIILSGNTWLTSTLG